MTAKVKPNPDPISDTVGVRERGEHGEAPVINDAAIELLRSWLEDDTESEAEQQEGLARLQEALDADRLPGHKLFA